jgi:hypothetical protein
MNEDNWWGWRVLFTVLRPVAWLLKPFRQQR